MMRFAAQFVREYPRSKAPPTGSRSPRPGSNVGDRAAYAF